MRAKRKHDKVARGYSLIFGYLGIFLIQIGIVCLIPLIMIPFFISEAGSFLAFLIPGLASVIAGIGLTFLIFHKERAQLGKFQDSVLLVMIWLFAILVGAIPFLLRGLVVEFSPFSISFNSEYCMSFSDAIFESTSGYSSSGLTVFKFGTDLPGYHLFTFYRSLLLLFGGIGLVLIVTSAISDRYGLKLYTAEGHNDKLMPNLVRSARLILLIYLGYILVGTLSYWILGGMTFFDSLNHAIAAVATGGFSTRAGGLPEIIQEGAVNEIGRTPSAILINLTSAVLMILGATNFLLHLFFYQGKIKHIIKDVEIRFFAIISMIFIPLFIASILLNPDFYGQPGTAINEGVYYYLSAITTTGFTSVQSVTKLGHGVILLCTIMMCIGGGMGSTAGAIKQYRVVLAVRSLYWSIRDSVISRRILSPHDVYRLGKRRDASVSETHEALGYMLLYVLFLLAGTIVITILGANGGPEIDGVAIGPVTFEHALFEFASALSGTGLSVGVTNTAFYNTIAINWVLVIGMFAGRLEIMAIYFAFYRTIRDIFRKETV